MADRIEVTLYTRADCPLCDKAKAAMHAAASLHRLPLVIREVDIDRDPALRERFANDVPVIYVGAHEAFRHRVTPEEFAAAVTGRGPEEIDAVILSRGDGEGSPGNNAARRSFASLRMTGEGEEPVRSGGAATASVPASSLATEKCVPCHGGVPPVTGDELTSLQRDLGGGWRVVEEHHLEKDFTFPDFASALAFANRVGAIADEEGHHPDLLVAWGKVRVTIWTHAVNGLTRSDFVLAAKIDGG